MLSALKNLKICIISYPGHRRAYIYFYLGINPTFKDNRLYWDIKCRHLASSSISKRGIPLNEPQFFDVGKMVKKEILIQKLITKYKKAQDVKTKRT